VPRDYIVITFEKKAPLWSQCIQRSNCDYIWKENSIKSSGFFVKENPSFFHNFVHNVSTLNLSHSLKVLSQNALQCNQNVPSRFFSKKSQWNHTVAQFYHKLSKNSLSIWLDILWLHCRAFCERTFNEWLRFRVDTLWTKLWKKLGFSFTKNPLLFVLFSFQM